MKIKSILLALMFGVGMHSGIIGMDTPPAPSDAPSDQPTTEPAATSSGFKWSSTGQTFTEWLGGIKESIMGKTAEEQKTVTDAAKAVWNAIPESVKSVGGNVASYYVLNAMGGPVGIASSALSGAWTVLGWVGGPTAVAKYAAWNGVQSGLQTAYNNFMKNPEKNADQIAGIKQESLQQMEIKLANQVLYPTYWIQINALDDPDEFPCNKENTLCIEGKKKLRTNLAAKIASLKTQDMQEFQRQADINAEVVELRKNFAGYKTDFRGYINYINSVIQSGLSDEVTIFACLSEKGRTAEKAMARKIAEGGTQEASEEELMGISSRRRTTQPIAKTLVPSASAQLQPVYIAPAVRTTTEEAPGLRLPTEELSSDETAQFRALMERQSPTNRAAILEYMRRLKENDPDEMVRYVKAQLAKVPAPQVRVPQFEPQPASMSSKTTTKRSSSPTRGRSQTRRPGK